jgi:hypothetical protein
MTILRNVILDDDTLEVIRMFAEDNGISTTLAIRTILQEYAKAYTQSTHYIHESNIENALGYEEPVGWRDGYGESSMGYEL